MNRLNNITRRTASAMFAALVLTFALSATAAQAQTTAFTYQGKLTDSAGAASNSYDMRFRLYDTPTVGTGTQAGDDVVFSAATNNAVNVSNGVFTVALDFGQSPFAAGAARFLEIAVKKASEANYTILADRQPITASPYSIRTLSAKAADALSSACVSCVTNAQINSVDGAKVAGSVANATNAANADNLGGTAASGYVRTNDARLSDSRTPTAGSQNYIQNGTTRQSSSDFNISGSGTVGGTLTANTTNVVGTTDTLFNVQSSSSNGTWLTLDNATTDGGQKWSIISTGPGSSIPAGNLLFYNSTYGYPRLALTNTGVSVSGSLNAHTINARLPVLNRAPSASSCSTANDYGRPMVDAENARLYICTQAGWKFAVLQ